MIMHNRETFESLQPVMCRGVAPASTKYFSPRHVLGAEKLKKLIARTSIPNPSNTHPLHSIAIAPAPHAMSTCKSLLRIRPQQIQPSLTPLTQCRHESTTRRHKKLLALPEAPSYTADRSQPTLIFNPPSSAPNVYHTPHKFLPKSDSRRALYAAALHQSTHTAQRLQSSHVAAPGTPLHVGSRLPPRPRTALPDAVRQPYEKKYHLGEKEIREIRELRTQDPYTWTRVKLAEKFGCSQFFVGMVVKAREKAGEVARGHEEVRRRWGTVKREAREDRVRRKEMWGRDA